MSKIKKVSWPLYLLNYLYKNYTSRNVRLNEIIVRDLRLKTDDIQDAHLIDKTLKELEAKRLIEYYTTAIQKQTSQKNDISKIGTNEGNIPGNLNHYYIDARLTLEGLNYVNNLEREKRLEMFSKISAFAALASAIFALIVLIATCNQKNENAKINKNYYYNR